MKQYLVDNPTRFFLLVSSLMVWGGIWATGFSSAHWLLYLPATFFLFAAATGICPGMLFSRMLFGNKNKEGAA